jgi:2,3-bisphosphoglycerate-independent phosphoglycerate mutase
MKIILVLLDGLGDRSYKILGYRTPLQAAFAPNLDSLASQGSNGLFHASLPGQCLPSETAHYLLFGYDPREIPGRGLLEAVGAGVHFGDHDVLSMAHLSAVTWENGFPVLCHGPEVFHRDSQEVEALFHAITPYEARGVQFRLHKKPFINDAILVINGAVSPLVSDSDPIIPGRMMARVVPLSNNEDPDKSHHTAQAMNEYLAYCHNVLENHEVNRRRRERNLPLANFLATQRCGRRILYEPFKHRWGFSGMLIASGSVYGGLAHELGLTFEAVRDGKDPGEDLRERIRIALNDGNHDFFHVHTKVPDEAAHTGDPERKKTVITSLDCGLDEMVEAVQNRDDLLVAVTADHSTPSMSKLIHSGEPVPITLIGANVRRDDVHSFDEVHAATGCLGFIRGRELMLMLLNYADRSSFLSHRLGNRERPWAPDDYESFTLKPDFPSRASTEISGRG